MVDETVQVLRNGTITLPDRSVAGDLILESGRIRSLAPAGQGRGEILWDLEGRRIAPGLIDLHTHGGWGVDFARDSVDRMVEAATLFAKAGVSRLLPTLYPGPIDWMLDRLAVCAEACEASSSLVGIHLEGPFLAKDRKGALPEAGILEFEPELFDRLLQASKGQLRIMTFAPDVVPVAWIRKIQSTGVTLSIGHTSASADETEAAIRAGVTRATHLCNAMPGIHHRDPGPIVSLLLDSRVRTEVIADGVHLDDRFLRLILQCKGLDGVIAVSDSMPLAGLGACTGEFAGVEIMSDGKRACRQDGALAGSVATLYQALERTQESLGLSAHERFRLGATAAAEDLPHSHLGRIATGAPADLVVLDKDDRTLLATLRAGQRIDEPAPEGTGPILPEGLRAS